MRGWHRRFCSRRSRFSTSPARTSASACISPPIRRGGNCACAPISPFQFRATISPRPRPASRGVFAISARFSGIAPRAAAGSEMLALGLDATAHYGLGAPDIRMGDVALFCTLVAALDLAPAWKRRLIKDFNHKTSLAQDLDRLTIGASHARSEYQGVLAALAGSDPKGAHALVTDLLSIAGITAVGGRSVGEIADHFLEQAALGAQTSLPRETRALIEKFLAITGDPHEAAAKLRAFAREGKIALDGALDAFESRTAGLAARGVDVARIRFSTAFGRGLDYYTGFVFELHDPLARALGPLVAGGRYDGLLTRLGSASAIAAVGFAVWIERLAALRSAS